MAGISWIKLSVNIFDDEKIKVIRKLPEGDSVTLVWIHLLCLAGKTNDGGSVYIGQSIPYTDEMLSAICGEPINIIRLAIETFKKFEMVSIEENGIIEISNWEKHQNIEGMEKIREQNRLRKQRQREREKQKALPESHVTSRDSHNAVNESHRTDIDKDIDKELDIDLDRDKDIDIGVGDDFEKQSQKDVLNTNALTKDNLQKIKDNWNDLDVNIPKLKKLNSDTQRFKLLKARVNENSIETVLKAIENINHSQFLQGYTNDFTITFDWFVKPNNFIKVLEGNYTDRDYKNKKGNAYHGQINNQSYSEMARKKRMEKILNEKNYQQ